MLGNKGFYDIQQLRDIPILDVCDYLSLTVEKRSNNYWCKIKPDHKTNVMLHTNTNYFYDFDSRAHGNNIDFVSFACGGISSDKSIRKLAYAFNVSADQKHSDFEPLSLWEYRKIGIHLDIESVTKDEDSMDRGYSFCVYMNNLRCRSPEKYRSIIEKTAVPYINKKMATYFSSVLSYYDMLNRTGTRNEFFKSEKTEGRFELARRDLEQALQALKKAGAGTGIELPDYKSTDPFDVIKGVLHGEIDLDEQ